MDLGWLLVPLVAGMWFWWDTSASKELARQFAKQQCELQQVQLLDDTVALKKTRLQRSPAGHMTLERTFHFEFSGDGDQRVQGYLILMGRKIQKVHLDIHRIH